jgi:flagella basal body P-ring formation protein FlgA
MRLKLGPCSAGTAHLLPGVPAWGASRVGVRCTQGAAWNIQLPVKVQVFAPAVVAATVLSSGTTLSTTQLALAEADWGAHGAPAALVSPGGGNGASLFGDIQLLEGRVLSRPAAAGAPVKAADLQVRQWFAAGTTVSVVALGGGFSVVAEGQALSAGLEGQLVRVRTEGGRVVAGHATGERRVEVRL